jgi:anti-anti-sigma factor
MNFSLVSEGDGATCITCSGHITQYEFKPNVDPLTELLGDRSYSRRVLLDLEQTEYIDSSGIGWLLASHKRFLQDGGELILHSLPPMVYQVVKLLRLEKVLNIERDLAFAKVSATQREKKI